MFTVKLRFDERNLVRFHLPLVQYLRDQIVRGCTPQSKLQQSTLVKVNDVGISMYNQTAKEI